ncbi:MAG: DUF1564 domain-containing protein [Leptospiraceae bacterium]|nr:DUF1564 family protein [Leptospiraceae bacterium]MCK6380927.1 DUF1564 domain-containing protein [Leptospiraceae bacterium]NUM40017.1 DUF1564 family protein [Leptospiraceae bacterium]
MNKKQTFTEFDLKNSLKASNQVATLLIPEKTVIKLRKFYRLKDIPKILNRLIANYKILPLNEEQNTSKKIQSSYQMEGQNLFKKSFRPIGDDWIKLSILSNGTGDSRCLFFFTLLSIKLEILEGKNPDIEKSLSVGTPTNFNESVLRCMLGLIKSEKQHKYYRAIEEGKRREKQTTQIN